MPRRKMECSQLLQWKRGQQGEDIRAGEILDLDFHLPTHNHNQINLNLLAGSPPARLISVTGTLAYPAVQLKNPSIIFDFSLKASPPASCWPWLQKTPQPSSPHPLLASSTPPQGLGSSLVSDTLHLSHPIPHSNPPMSNQKDYF